jgi:hypothetical protein
MSYPQMAQSFSARPSAGTQISSRQDARSAKKAKDRVYLFPLAISSPFQICLTNPQQLKNFSR